MGRRDQLQVLVLVVHQSIRGQESAEAAERITTE